VHRLLAAILLCCPAFCWGAEPTILPKEGQYVGFVRVDTPSGWVCLSKEFDSVETVLIEGDEKAGYRTCAVHGPAGKYAVLQINGFVVKTHKVTLGPVGPTPPVPPKPEPPPGPPEPPPNPTPAGTRTVLIFHESGQQTPAQGILFNQLRSGDSGAYLKSKGHKVHILDDDSVGSDGKPALESWAKHLAGIALPAIVIADDKGRVVHKGPCPAGTPEVLDLIKASGG
jgi:hypothetical protein